VNGQTGDSLANQERILTAVGTGCGCVDDGIMPFPPNITTPEPTWNELC
jgi:hypothetical protein